jgi:Uma2 family endonuclease
MADVPKSLGASIVSTKEARKPRPRRMLDGVPPETRVVIADVTWDFYESFVESIAEGENVRVAFDGKDIEVMTLGPFHESLGGIVAVFIATIAAELGVEHQPIGSTTWKRKSVKRGVESDLCYYFDHAKLATFTEAFARRSNKVEDYPNPDLAIEIDISRSEIDRAGIYAALKVPELWRFHKEQFSIAQLRPDGTYAPASQSRFLAVRPDDITRWILEEQSPRGLAWQERLREWVRADLGLRANG